MYTKDTFDHVVLFDNILNEILVTTCRAYITVRQSIQHYPSYLRFIIEAQLIIEIILRFKRSCVFYKCTL